MARCHRIGQDKEVTVYRLITKDTYEENLFQTASRKYGEQRIVQHGNVTHLHIYMLIPRHLRNLQVPYGIRYSNCTSRTVQQAWTRPS